MWTNLVRMLAAGTVLAFAGHAAAQRPPSVVDVAPVVRQKISETRRVLGQLIVPVQSEIASRTAGVIESVSYEIGDRVAQGQELVRLDTSLLEIERRAAQSALAVTEAGVAVAKAKLHQSELAFQRQSDLRSSGAFSRARFEDLQQEVVTAQAELSRAEAQAVAARTEIARVDYQLKYAIITAPVGGAIIQRTAQPGNYIKVGDSVATILDISQLEITADVPATLVGGLPPGTSVPATAVDGTRIDAKVRTVIPVEELTTQTRPVRLTADFGKLDPALIASGKSLMLDVPSGRAREVLAVPKDALVQALGSWVVFAVRDGKAERVPVDIGDASGGYVEVRSGVSEGESVVIRGNERLRPGQPVSTGKDTRPSRPARS